MEASYYASTDLAQMYCGDLSDLPAAPEFKRSTSIDTVAVALKEIDRGRLRPLEKLGQGQFGEIHLCQLIQSSNTFDKDGNQVRNSKLISCFAIKMIRNLKFPDIVIAIAATSA